MFFSCPLLSLHTNHNTTPSLCVIELTIYRKYIAWFIYNDTQFTVVGIVPIGSCEPYGSCDPGLHNAPLCIVYRWPCVPIAGVDWPPFRRTETGPCVCVCVCVWRKSVSAWSGPGSRQLLDSVPGTDSCGSNAADKRCGLRHHVVVSLCVSLHLLKGSALLSVYYYKAVHKQDRVI